MADFTCTKCGATLQEDDFNLELGVARCGYCHAWTKISLPDQPSRTSPGPREFPIPEKYNVEESADELKISWKWFSPLVLFMVPFCLFWDGFLVFWYSIAFSGFGTGGMEWMMVLFPLMHVAVGVGLTYFTLAMIFNTSTILASGYRLAITHGPIPWKNVEVNNTDDLKQLYCQEKISHNKNSVSYSYDVKAVLFNGKELKLLSRLSSIQEAIYIEHKIEEFLGIEDRPVAGEVPK